MEKLFGKSVLITGATGTIGSFVADTLIRFNHQNAAKLKIYLAGRDLEKLRMRFEECENIDFLIYDMESPIKFEVSVDYIIHAAGNAHPAAFNGDPVGTIIGNVESTFALLEYLKKHCGKRLLYVSSGEVYGQGDVSISAFKEEYAGYVNALSPRSCYPLSKRTTENLCVSYWKQYGGETVIVRPCHTYGPCMTTTDNRAHVQFFHNALDGEDILLKSAGRQMRSYNYVADCVAGLLGNWFYYAKNMIVTKGANVELSNTWRTDDPKLIGLWNEVREHKPLITERMAIDGPFSEKIGADLLKEDEYKDHVVLCLNYDGKFGLNNMNNYFQCANNKGEPVVWDEWTYKKGDPVLFNDSKRFPILYNNLKGWIAEIEKTKKEIQFTIDIDLMLTEKECKENGIEYIGENGKYTRIRFSVFKYDNNVPDDKEDKIDEMRMKAVVPFQLAYAVSIHKAQGLEYDSVKIVIPDSNSERVTHGVFYTAITRAKKKLKIYWSAETMQSIVDEFSNDEMGNRSLEIIKKKLS